MTFNEATEYLFTQLPVFQRQGATAYKPGLDTARTLDCLFGNPHTHYPTIHIAGTNGKGSTAHTIAAVLQSAGYKTGLYTSPHLVDFRERIRVDGEMIPERDVVDFVQRYKEMDIDCSPSFFELTMTMAFEYFAKCRVDIAVIETGLGGRLDSTNIISPELCVITNISFDHTQFLGHTLKEIAAEKAGIIKSGTPVVIGEADSDTRTIFEQKALSVNAPVIFASDNPAIKETLRTDTGFVYRGTPFGDITGELCGDCQRRNSATIITALLELAKKGYDISPRAVKDGFSNVTAITGLRGRWEKIGDAPICICDTGHNIGGWRLLAPQIASLPGKKHIIVGFANDKDISGILLLLKNIPDATYIFTQASVARAMDAGKLCASAANAGIAGITKQTVKEAYEYALADCGEGDSVFVGGSTFVVADLLSYLTKD